MLKIMHLEDLFEYLYHHQLTFFLIYQEIYLFMFWKYEWILAAG